MSTTTEPLPHYKPRPQSASMWMFTTPYGDVRNLISEPYAKSRAEMQRRSDIELAYTDMEGATANLLRNYFDSLTETKP